MEPRTVLRLLRELILLGRWEQVGEQLDLLHVDAIGQTLIGLDRTRLERAFALLPAARRPAVFARLGRNEQRLLLDALDAHRARRMIRGLLPEHRQALLQSRSIDQQLRAVLN